MNDIEDLVARLAAFEQGRAVRIRETTALAPDPDNVIGIATIRVVTEDQVQALAYGMLGRDPATTARVHPLGRDTSDLEPYAEWLVKHVEERVSSEQPLRLWVPHGKTIETLEILGRRYERNRHASPTLQKAARLCRIIAEEKRYAGQQTVAVALETLLLHVTTGQMPIEDQHLGAVLAWVVPEKGRDPRQVAAERARLPASGILVNTPDLQDDDRVEHLRKELKSASGPRRIEIESEIRRILSDAVMREWNLLEQARRAFWDLDFGPGAVESLVRASQERVSWAVQNHLISPRRAIPITRKLEEYEVALRRADDSALRSDSIVRRKAARRGHVIEGVVEQVDQPQRNRHPCFVLLRTYQANLRVRIDDRVSLIGGSVEGIVRELQPGDHRSTLIGIELLKGVRRAHSMVGNSQEWIEARDFPPFLRHRALSEAQSRGTWMVDGSAPPPAQPVSDDGNDPLALAQNARRQP